MDKGELNIGQDTSPKSLSQLIVGEYFSLFLFFISRVFNCLSLLFRRWNEQELLSQKIGETFSFRFSDNISISKLSSLSLEENKFIAWGLTRTE